MDSNKTLTLIIVGTLLAIATLIYVGISNKDTSLIYETPTGECYKYITKGQYKKIKC